MTHVLEVLSCCFSTLEIALATSLSGMLVVLNGLCGNDVFLFYSMLIMISLNYKWCHSVFSILEIACPQQCLSVEIDLSNVCKLGNTGFQLNIFNWFAKIFSTAGYGGEGAVIP